MLFEATGKNILVQRVSDPFKLQTSITAVGEEADVQFLKVVSIGQDVTRDMPVNIDNPLKAFVGSDPWPLRYELGTVVCIPSGAGRKIRIFSEDYLLIKEDAIYGIAFDEEAQEVAVKALAFGEEGETQTETHSLPTNDEVTT